MTHERSTGRVAGAACSPARQPSLHRFTRIATGACFVIFPAVWIFAFAVHPDLLKPRLLLGPAELVQRARGDGLLQFAHALVTVNTAVLIVLTLHFTRRLEETRAAWAGMAGAGLAVLGACLLAAEKGALCLTMSALETVPDPQFAAMMPGLLAIFSFKGWLALVWGLVFMPLGVMIQAAGMMVTQQLPRWQAGLLLVSIPFVGFPDGAEIVNLLAAVAMAAAMIPYGAALIASHAEDR
jgi:hypothetical protein